MKTLHKLLSLSPGTDISLLSQLPRLASCLRIISRGLFQNVSRSHYQRQHNHTIASKDDVQRLTPVADSARTISDVPQKMQPSRLLSLSNSGPPLSWLPGMTMLELKGESHRLTRHAYTHSSSFRSNRLRIQECIADGCLRGFKWKNLLESVWVEWD